MMTLETTDANYKKVKVAVVLGLAFFTYMNMRDNIKKLYADVGAGDWYKTPETVSYLKDNLKDNERVTSELYFYASYPYFITNPAVWNDPVTHLNLRNLLPPFSGLLYDIPQNVGAANSGGLKISRYNELESEIYFNGLKQDEKGDFSLSDSFLFLNRIMGVKYILSNKEFSSYVTSVAKKFEMPQGEDPIFIYEFFDYFPRQFLVPHAEKEEPEKIKEHLLKADFEPKDHVYIEEDSDWGAKGGYSANSRFAKYTDTEVVIKTQASGDGYLFLSDTYYPGWKAYIDGKEEKIYLANYAFRAVQVPQGEHEVTFKYEPESVKYGISISLITGGIFLIFLIGITIVKITQNLKLKSQRYNLKLKSNLKDFKGI